jgi:hypothetical protein
MENKEIEKKMAKILKYRKMGYERIFKEEFIMSDIEEIDYGWEVTFTVDRKPLPLWGNHLYVSNTFLVDTQNNTYYVPTNVSFGLGYLKYYANKRKNKLFVFRVKIFNFIWDGYERLLLLKIK